MVKTRRPWAQLALIVLVAVSTSHSAGAESFVQRRVRRFIFHGKNSSKASAHFADAGPRGITLATRDLASRAEVPICFEELPSSPGEPVVPVEIDAKDSTVKDILDDMISQDPRYVYRERLGVIEVFPRGADHDPTDCLNVVIRSFKERNEWNSLIIDLRVQVAIVSRSIKEGVVRGASGLPHAPPGLIEASFENETLRDILDKLCAKVGNMAWTAGFDVPRATCQDMSFGAYQPKAWYSSDSVPLTWTQGLPSKCKGCHYHKQSRTN